MVGELGQESEALRQRLEGAAEAGERAGRLLQELDERTRQLEEARTRIVQLENKLTELGAVEERVDRSLELATERQAAVDTMRSDLQRLFEVADATMEQVRGVAALQQEIEGRRQSLDSVIVELRELDRHAESLEERKRQFQEAEERLSRLDALLIDLQSTLQTVLDQKEFLEKVVQTAGSLAFQTMQAEAAINTLREEREAAGKSPGQ